MATIATAGLLWAASGAGADIRVTQLVPERDAQPQLARDFKGPVSFSLSLAYSCPGSEDQASVFLSIADTSLTAALSNSPQDVLVKVPVAQLPGIAAAAHCKEPGPRLLTAQVNAFATLLCTTDGSGSSSTVTTPLAVWFDCPLDAETEEPSPRSLDSD
jgi:hypothetical protein